MKRGKSRGGAVPFYKYGEAARALVDVRRGADARRLLR